MVAVTAAISTKDTTYLEIHVSSRVVMYHLLCHMLTILQGYAQIVSTIALLVIMLLFARHAHLIIFYILMQLVNFRVLQVVGISIVPKGVLRHATYV